MAAFVLLQSSGLVVTETIWPTNLKIFTIWPSAKKKKKNLPILVLNNYISAMLKFRIENYTMII